MRHSRWVRPSTTLPALAPALVAIAILLGAGISGCTASAAHVDGGAATVTQTTAATPSSSRMKLGMAIEFTDHAAGAMVALNKGWFASEGIDVETYETYVTGVDLAAALARGDIQVGYMCLVPAIAVRANGGVPIKVVAGTHLYGYSLVVNPSVVSTIADLAKPEVRVGCTQTGTVSDVLLHRLCDDNDLPTETLMSKLQRMNPPSQVLALKAGAIDACLVPEHWGTVAESLGFTVLLTAQDMWPQLQGSVLVVKEDLLSARPDIVASLVRVTEKAEAWITTHPDEVAAIVASYLTATSQRVFPEKAAEVAARLEIDPELVKRSMARLDYTSSVDPNQVQQTIDYLNSLGYLKRPLTASDLLDLTYLKR